MKSAARYVALALALSCVDATAPPRGQVLLYFDTDAPVPSLFDSLSVDVFEPGKTTPCAHCSRLFALTPAMFTAPEGVSIGVPLPPNEKGWVVRARLYTSTATLSGQPPDAVGSKPPQSVIDVYASLPELAATGIVARSIVMHVADVGNPLGSLDAPVDTSPGPVHQSIVGTWSGASSVPCVGAPRDDEVCVPGGAYWMGNPRVLAAGAFVEAGSIEGAAGARRLVVVSPFFLKRTEVTVREFRDSGLVGPTTVDGWSGSTSGNAVADYCTITAVPGVPADHEDLPINCVTRVAARQYCQGVGGDLPTEAQYEYVASQRVGALFPWDAPLGEITCEDAAWGRAGYGLYVNIISPCKSPTPPGGPVAVGTKMSDRVSFDGGDVVDLAGNLREFVLDIWNREDEPCWSQPGVSVDPVCTTPGAAGPAWSLRGGDWRNSAPALAAARRYADADAKTAASVFGFRCARPAN